MHWIINLSLCFLDDEKTVDSVLDRTCQIFIALAFWIYLSR